MFDVIPVKTGIQKNNSHPEFISGYIKKMLEQVQHEKKVWIPMKTGMTSKVRSHNFLLGVT
ncbi:hypothetical protein [Rickettsia endosymbiont of Polydrusus tereticollis]|uniref:hypothetical protein n=1 Tax=Rickettsia endosymbiont of Polydrusus tereticollis TaxID=3066251 RepID=UPI0031332105